MENTVANEMVENVVEDVVDVVKPKFNWGKAALVATGVGALVLGAFAWAKKRKAKAKAKDEKKAETEAKNENWVEKLDAVAKEEPIDNLD